jgi:hypothetical protein
MTNLRLSTASGTAATTAAAVSTSSPVTVPARNVVKDPEVSTAKAEVAKEEVVSDDEGMSDAEVKVESDTESALDLLRKAASGQSPTD